MNHGPVRNWLLTAPWWVLSLIGGATLSLTSTAAGRLVGDESWSEAVVSGVISGIFFGAVMGPVIARRNRRFRDAAGDIPRDQLLQVAKLAQRGAAPEDAELRRAAHRVALDQLGEPEPGHRPAASPGYTHSPTILGLATTSFANQKSGMSANSSKR